MVKTILVPLDGSPLAERALPYAAVIARRTGATLRLLRVLPLPMSLGMAVAAGEAATEAERYLAARADDLMAHGLTAETWTAHGEAAEMIVGEAALREATMIVMATHGRSELKQLVFGSVAEGVLQRGTVPILMVRAWAEADAPPSLAAHPKVIVPLDGSAFAEAALSTAATLTMALGGELVLLRAVPPLDPLVAPELAGLWPADLPARMEESRHYLHSLVTRNLTGGCQVHFDLRAATPTVAIDQATREYGAGLVVMATHGRGALGRLVLGGVAHATLEHGRAPLLLIRPRAQDVAEAASAGARHESR